MAWVTFTADFDFTPPEAPLTMMAYLAGQTLPVRRVCADLAVALERAVEIPTPSRARAKAILKRGGYDAQR